MAYPKRKQTGQTKTLVVLFSVKLGIANLLSLAMARISHSEHAVSLSKSLSGRVVPELLIQGLLYACWISCVRNDAHECDVFTSRGNFALAGIVASVLNALFQSSALQVGYNTRSICIFLVCW